MAIRRDDLRKIDFSDVATGRRLPPVHPGDVLLKDFIEPLEISRYRVAKNTNVSQRRIDLICRGEEAVSADMALRLGRLFGTTPEFWVNLQAQYDLEVADAPPEKRLQGQWYRWQRDASAAGCRASRPRNMRSTWLRIESND